MLQAFQRCQRLTASRSLIYEKVLHNQHTRAYELVITGKDAVPVEISHGGVSIKRHNMTTTHKEVDVILVQQMSMVAKETQCGISVLADDTDMFRILLHQYVQQRLTSVVIMESPIKEWTIVDIDATVQWILAAHPLSGCDTVVLSYSVGFERWQASYYAHVLGEDNVDYA